MTTIGRYKRISELPESRPEDVEVLGLNAAGTNVRVRYDVRQTVGASETSVMSQAAVTAELKKRDAAISELDGTNLHVGRSVRYGNTTIAKDTPISDALERLSERVEEVAAVEIPDNSIAEVKLVEAVKDKINHDNGYLFIVVDNDVGIRRNTVVKTTFLRSTNY